MGGAILASLSGCALLPPGPPPVPVAPPSGALLPGQEAILTLRAALDAGVGTAEGASHAAMLAWALSVSDDQLAALSLPPATASPAPGTALTEAGLTPALAAAASAFAAQADAPDTARPLVWAAMAAWASALAATWAQPAAALEPARTVLTPAPQTQAEAVVAAQDAAHEAIYGLEVAAGAPGLASEEVTALRSQRAAWLTLRDALAQATPSPGPAAPWYRIARPTDAAAGRALAAKLQGDALPVLGRAYASAPAAVRPALAAQLAASASGLPQVGGLLQRWPGLPLT